MLIKKLKMSKKRNLGTSKSSLIDQISKRTKSSCCSSSGSNTTKISKYFNNRNDMCEASCSKTSNNRCKDTKMSDTVLRKLSDSGDEFETPEIRSGLTSRLNEIIKKKRQKLITDWKEPKDVDVDSDELQMALARSMSMEECNGNNLEKSMLNVMTTLERYGFQSKQQFPVTNKRSQKGEVKKRPNTKLKRTTWLLNSLSLEERKNRNHYKIALILSYLESCYLRLEIPSNVEYYLTLDSLKKIQCKETKLFKLNSQIMDDYYVCSLGLDRTTAKTGYLLKDWHQIPGRERSPERFESRTLTVSPDLFEEEYETPFNYCDIGTIEIQDTSNTFKFDESEPQALSSELPETLKGTPKSSKVFRESLEEEEEGSSVNKSSNNLCRALDLDLSKTSSKESSFQDDELNYSCNYHLDVEDELEDVNVTNDEEFFIKTDNVTPMPDYESMESSRIVEELAKYGVKSLKRRRGIDLLKHIYESTHPLIETPVDNDVIDGKIVNEIKNFNWKEYDGEELIFEPKQSKKIKGCRIPLHIVWHNFLEFNPQIMESILLYEPVQLEVLHDMLKEQGYKFHLTDFLKFLDKKCITVRLLQKK